MTALWSLLLQLCRLRMTVFSAVTYSTAFTLALVGLARSSTENPLLFFLGWVFVLLCQLSAHLLGEYFDFDADRLTLHTSPFTGGSRVLVRHPSLRAGCGLLGWACGVAALLLLRLALPAPVNGLGLSMLFLATQYSAAPLRLNHRYLGEVCAAVVMNVLLPLFAAQLALPAGKSVFTEAVPNMLLLIVPSAVLKFALFLVLNLADKRSDWLAGKHTLPVLLDAPRTARLHCLAVCLAYASVPALLLAGPLNLTSVVMAALILTSAPRAWRIARHLLTNGDAPFTPLVLCSLQQAPLPLLAVFGTSLLSEALQNPWRIITLGFHLRCAVIYPFLVLLLQQPQVAPPPAPAQETAQKRVPVLIIGGGVAGLVFAASLQRLGIGYTLLEKRSKEAHEDGADLGLWPSAVCVMRALGVPTSFFEQHSYPVKHVHMRAVSGELLKDINMGEVVGDTGEHFRLIGRQSLMRALRDLLPPEASICYGAVATRIVEDAEKVSVEVALASGETQTLQAAVVVGADGINSVCRPLVLPGGSSAVRRNGEVCYRGTLNLADTPALRAIFKTAQSRAACTMTLLYGAGVRASWGVLDESAKQGFWWVKVPDEHSSAKSQPEEDERKVVAASKQWPEPFALLYAATPERQRYVHVVADRLHSDRWCSSRCALVGDAAHPVTPNMAQGANLAMEDAFVLAVLLSRATQANEKDARLEAFYQYCRLRQPHVARVAAESYQQSKIGQWRHPLLVKLREAILRLVPASVLQKKLKKVNVWPIATWVAEFQDRVASGSHAPPLGQQPELRT